VLVSTRQPAAPERGVHLVSHKTATSTDGIVCASVTPRRTEWLPALLTALRPHTEETIREYTTTTTESWRTSTALCARLHPGYNSLEETWTDDIAEAVAYTHAITALATTYEISTETLSGYHQQRHADLIDTVESIGTGRGALNAGLGALMKGPVALHRALDTTPQPITLQLDGPEWTTLEDRRTGSRALATIAVLAHGFDIRLVVSPALHTHLATRYPRWTDSHLGLTDRRERSPRESHHQSLRGDDAWTALRDLDTAPTKRRLLTHLSREHGHSYAALSREPALDIAAGTVSRYILDLETRGLVTVRRRGRSNSVRLTELGETATDRYLSADAALIHPDQSRLGECLTPTPHESTSTVSPRRADSPEPPRPDAWVAATGDPEDDAEYVQWLTGPDTIPDHQIHERFVTPASENSITLVDDQPDPFADGRVAYLSHHNDEALIVLQWGGPLATLGRLAGVLLSEKALSTLLAPSRVGVNFEALHRNTTRDTPEILRRGHQVGWYADADTTDGAWRDRITSVRDRLLSRVADLSTSTDTAARAELFEDLHGFVASATQLYHAAGIDLTTTLRIPDTETLTRSVKRQQDLCDFLRYTVPKQSVYQIHSGYRMLFEDRPDKLRRRLPYEVEPHAHFDLTMSWVIAGPTATALNDAITAALTGELATVREAIADGTPFTSLLGAGMVMILGGIAFKIAAVPFHFWAPDAYEGAPAPISAFISSASKAAGFVLGFRVFVDVFGAATGVFDWVDAFLILSVVTMTVANFSALKQNNVKRILAYSSVAHAGYVLIALAAFTGSVDGEISILGAGMAHLFVYGFMNTGAFLFIALAEHWEVGRTVEDYHGLGEQAPFACAAMTVFLFSLAGLPIGGGFFSKFYLFQATLNVSAWSLAAALVINSALSLFYYSRVVKAMWIEEPTGERTIESYPTGLYTAIVAAAVITVLLIPGFGYVTDVAFRAVELL